MHGQGVSVLYREQFACLWYHCGNTSSSRRTRHQRVNLATATRITNMTEASLHYVAAAVKLTTFID
eukprot:4618-Heterococcus_DN1.PRE.3